MNWAKEELCGWGRYPIVESAVARPGTLAEVAEVVRAESGCGGPSSGLLAYGLGRSYGDAGLLRGGKVLRMHRLDQLLDFDPSSGTLSCQAGVSLEEILEVFVPQGFFLPVLPGTKFVTVGGAIANDVHGKNHHMDGSFTDHLASIDLLLATGDVVRASRKENSELFHATVGGLGLTGLILSAEITLRRVHGPWIEMESLRVRSLDEFFELSSESAGFSHVVSWIDCIAKGKNLGRGILMRGRHAEGGLEGSRGLLGKLPLTVPFDLPGILLNPLSMKAFNELFYRKQFKRHSRGIVHYEPWFFPLDGISHWNRAYGRRGMLQYQLVVPHDPDHRAIRKVIERIAASGMGSFLAVIKEFGEIQHGGLTFPMPGVMLALDFPNYGQALLDLLDQLDAIVVEAGGKVYLGKDARLSRDMFQEMYPGWREWKEVRDTWDPEGLFQSELGRRLGLVKA